MKCYDQAAAAFGWNKRNGKVGAMRDGDWLVGWGCATAVYPTHIGPAAAAVHLKPSGNVRVRIAAHEIGNGVYTVLGQMAAERLGVPLSSGQCRSRRHPTATRACRRRFQYHREQLQRRDENLRHHSRQALPRRGDRQ